MSKRIMWVIVMIGLLPLPLLAQQIPRSTIDDRDPIAAVEMEDVAGTSGGAITQAPGRSWTTIEIVLSVAVLVFAVIVFALQAFLMVKLKLDWTPASVLRFNGLTLIISSALLLVVAGYSNQQIAPVTGLLGAIAGYLLGAGEKPGKGS